MRAQAQGHVLIADWSLPPVLPILLYVMNDKMAASVHFGARLGAFFY